MAARMTVTSRHSKYNILDRRNTVSSYIMGWRLLMSIRCGARSQRRREETKIFAKMAIMDWSRWATCTQCSFVHSFIVRMLCWHIGCWAWGLSEWVSCESSIKHRQTTKQTNWTKFSLRFCLQLSNVSLYEMGLESINSHRHISWNRHRQWHVPSTVDECTTKFATSQRFVVVAVVM